MEKIKTEKHGENTVYFFKGADFNVVISESLDLNEFFVIKDVTARICSTEIEKILPEEFEGKHYVVTAYRFENTFEGTEKFIAYMNNQVINLIDEREKMSFEIDKLNTSNDYWTHEWSKAVSLNKEMERKFNVLSKAFIDQICKE